MRMPRHDTRMRHSALRRRRTRTEPADRLTRPDNFCVVGRCFAPRWPLVSVNSAYNYVYGQQFN